MENFGFYNNHQNIKLNSKFKLKYELTATSTHMSDGKFKTANLLFITYNRKKLGKIFILLRVGKANFISNTTQYRKDQQNIFKR